MEITVYELIGLIKERKAPKNIMFDTEKYTLNSNYHYVRECGDFIQRLDFEYNLINCLDEEVEIIEEAEETQKIPRLSFQQIGSNNLEKGNYFRFVEDINKQIGGLGKKINDLIDEVNELKGGLNGNQS